jgi:hypothetical protein
MRCRPGTISFEALGEVEDDDCRSSWSPCCGNTKREGIDMSKPKYVLAASLGVIGALLVSGTASAAVTGFSYGATISPQKQSAKTFGAAAITSTLDTFYTGGFTPAPTTTIVQFARTSSSRPASWPGAP